MFASNISRGGISCHGERRDARSVGVWEWGACRLSNGLLIQYDTDADDFINKQPSEFDASYFKEVRGFYLPERGKKYAYTVGGIYLYDEKKKSYVSNFEAFETLSGTHVRSMYVDEYDRFWI